MCCLTNVLFFFYFYYCSITVVPILQFEYSIFHICVATLQGQAGPWYLYRWKNIHGALGMSGMPLFMGGQAMHTASCVSICMSHVMALAPQRGTHHGTCPLACLSSSSPPAGSPYLFKYKRGTKLARCQNIT